MTAILKTAIPLLFLAFCPGLYAQSAFLPYALLPDGLLKDAHLVVRSAETVFRIENESDATLERTWAITILNPEGNYAARAICLEDAFTKTKRMEGRLYDANGMLVRSMNKKDAEQYGGSAEYEFTDNRVRVMNLQDSKFPYTVEFRTKESIRGFFRIPEFELQRLGEAVEQAAYSIVAPAAYAFKWKGVNTALQPTISAKNDEKTWTWTAKTLSALPRESNQPYYDKRYAEVLFAPEKVKIDDYSGDLSNWTEAGRFFYTLNRDRDNLPADLQNTVRNLTANARTNREKIDMLYRYLQENQRYVSIQLGIGGWQTFDAAFVGTKKYGDCKALSNYMKALLKAVNIPAYQALVFGGQDGAPPIYEDIAVPRFNHVILYVPGEQLWLECTSATNPPGYLGDFTAGHPALLLTPDGGQLVHTPALTPETNTKRSHADLLLDEMGNATVRQHLIATGNRDPYYRSLADEKDVNERNKKFSENLPVSLSSLQTLTLAAAPGQPEVAMNCALETMSYATRSGKRMFVPLTKLVPLRRTLPSDERRWLDVQITDCYTVCDTLLLHFPGNYRVENLPANKKLVSAFGSYELQVGQENDALRIVRHAVLQPVAVPAARYEEVRQFYLEIAKAEGAQAVLVRKE